MKQVRVTQIYSVYVSHFNVINWTIVCVKVSYQQLAAMVVNCKISFDVLDSSTLFF